MFPDDLLMGRLFLIMPELGLDDRIIADALKWGYIRQEDYDEYLRVLRSGNKAVRIEKSLRNKTLLQRIMILAPEVMSVQTVNLLRNLKVLTEAQAHQLRILLRTGNALQAAVVSEEAIMARLGSVLKPLVSEEMIGLIRQIDNAKIEAAREALLRGSHTTRLDKLGAQIIANMTEDSINRAEKLRGYVRAGKVVYDASEEAMRARSAWDAVTLGLASIFSDDFLNAAVKAGVLSPGYLDTLKHLSDAGMNIWTKGVKSFDYEGWFARSLMISEGILSPETISALRALGVIDAKLAKMMYPAANVVRSLTRSQLGKYVAPRRIRVVPGESPLQVYARAVKDADGYMLRLLEESAKRSRLSAEAAMKKGNFGSLTRAAQERLVAREMQLEMRILAENLGTLIMFGEKDAARAALAAEEFLQRGVMKRLSPEDLRSLQRTAMSGLDSYVSRNENKLRLSKLVYGNYNVWSGKITREVQIGLLRGLSQRELAKSIERLILPNVRGGVSYAAMRLARTEINNAFHQTQIRYTREQPWVSGYKWNLSGSHPIPDICNEMAQDDHEDMGPGVYSKGNVPGKPHPQCFCYLTTVVDSLGDFEKKLRRGSYDRYLDQTKAGGDDRYSQALHSPSEQISEAIWGSVVPQALQGAKAVAGSIVTGLLLSRD